MTMDKNDLVNYDLTIEKIDEYIEEFINQNTREITLNECKLNFRIVDMIQATIGGTDILKQDRSYYSTILNHYASELRSRIYNILLTRE